MVALSLKSLENPIQIVAPAIISMVVPYTLLSMTGVEHFSHIEWISSSLRLDDGSQRNDIIFRSAKGRSNILYDIFLTQRLQSDLRDTNASSFDIF